MPPHSLLHLITPHRSLFTHSLVINLTLIICTLSLWCTCGVSIFLSVLLYPLYICCLYEFALSLWLCSVSMTLFFVYSVSVSLHICYMFLYLVSDIVQLLCLCCMSLPQLYSVQNLSNLLCFLSLSLSLSLSLCLYSFRAPLNDSVHLIPPLSYFFFCFSSVEDFTKAFCFSIQSDSVLCRVSMSSFHLIKEWMHHRLQATSSFECQILVDKR